MGSPVEYFSSWLMISAAGGAVFYLVDRRFGIGAYRWLYDMTHEHPLPADVRKGFVINRRSRARLTTASILSIFQSTAAVASGAADPLVEMLSFFAEVPCIMLGFYAGPFLAMIWDRKDKILDKVDRIEDGTSTFKKEFTGLSKKTLSTVREVLQLDDEPPKAEAGQSAKAADSAEVPALEAEQEQTDPREMITRYVDRNRTDAAE